MTDSSTRCASPPWKAVIGVLRYRPSGTWSIELTDGYQLPTTLTPPRHLHDRWVQFQRRGRQIRRVRLLDDRPALLLLLRTVWPGAPIHRDLIEGLARGQCGAALTETLRQILQTQPRARIPAILWQHADLRFDDPLWSRVPPSLQTRRQAAVETFLSRQTGPALRAWLVWLQARGLTGAAVHWHRAGVLTDPNLRDAAPAEIHRAAIRLEYAVFCKWNEQTPARPSVQSLQRYTPAPDDEDQRLAALWMQGTDPRWHDAVKERMLSARLAERTAKLLYEDLGFAVEDIAAKQPVGTDWKAMDLRLNGTVPIDIKNARRFPRKSAYTEHIVQRFKRDRDLSEVRIVGTLSPYHRGIRPLQLLGELTESGIARLERDLCHPARLRLRIGRDTGTRIYFPPWSFSAPDILYRDMDEHIARFRAERPSLPPADRPEGLLTLYGLAEPLPDAGWSVALVRHLRAGLTEGERLTLPRVFLGILTDFLLRPEDPTRYSALVSALPLLDPMDTLPALLEDLGGLWKHRDRLTPSLSSYTSFRFTGRGLLQGTLGLRQVTILAYCGGKVQTRGKKLIPCDVTSLVRGVNPDCGQGHLVCPQCGYCPCRSRELTGSG